MASLGELQRPDGSRYFGNGVWGPSDADKDLANSSRGSLRTFSNPSSRLLIDSGVTATAVLFAAGCQPAAGAPSESDHPSQTPSPSGEVLGASTNLSAEISDRVDKSLLKYIGHKVDTEDPEHRDQCMDYVDVALIAYGIPIETIRTLHAKDAFLSPQPGATDWFTFVEKSPKSIPPKGALVFFDNGPDGHVGISTGQGNVQGKDTDTFGMVSQNFRVPQVALDIDVSFKNVLGWAIPRKIGEPGVLPPFDDEIVSSTQLATTTPSPTPTELNVAELTSNEKAIALAAGYLFDVLGKSQDDGGSESLTPHINFPQGLTREDIIQQLVDGKEVVTLEDPIVIEWEFTVYQRDGDQLRAARAVGYAELASLSPLATPQDLNKADKANGKIFLGTASISGLMRGGEVVYDQTNYSSPAKVRKWLSTKNIKTVPIREVGPWTEVGAAFNEEIGTNYTRVDHWAVQKYQSYHNGLNGPAYIILQIKNGGPVSEMLPYTTIRETLP